ncbi:MAG: ABC transporter permease [Acidimicrobiia bacterium]|nr:ABC transporter permease [Acidimicrobiia bacterium]
MGRSARAIDLSPGADSRSAFLREFWNHRDVLAMLARTDFQVRYKRATLGVLWAVLVPLVQAGVLAVVFSRVLKFGDSQHYAVFVMSGVLPWTYFSASVTAGSTAVVDAAEITEKVWFPRAMLPVVPVIANTVGFGVTLVLMIAVMPLFGVTPSVEILWLIPGCALLVAFSAALALAAAALHVYFRDVRYLVQAGLLAWFYATPIIYPLHLTGGLRPVIEANPVTGILALFRAATVGAEAHWVRTVVIAVVWTVGLLVVAAESYRHRDRVLVDLL